MRFLIMGCNGMAGHVISLYLHENGHQVTGFAQWASRFVKTVVGDARDLPLVEKTVKDGEYDAIINCIGILNQFAQEDPEAAVFLNSYLPHYLEKVTAGTDTQVIHMSTDCVFSGEKGGYPEDALRDGRTFYDRSKALGELEDEKNLTLRNSIVGPDINENGIGLLNWFMKQQGPVQGYRKAIWTGQTTLQLAKTMEAAAKMRAHGLYNMVPQKPINKYDLLCLFNRELRREPIEIIPQDTFTADKSLVRTRYEGFNYEVPDYETMVRELGEWMRGHKELYPHYAL